MWCRLYTIDIPQRNPFGVWGLRKSVDTVPTSSSLQRVLPAEDRCEKHMGLKRSGSSPELGSEGGNGSGFPQRRRAVISISLDLWEETLRPHVSIVPKSSSTYTFYHHEVQSGGCPPYIYTKSSVTLITTEALPICGPDPIYWLFLYGNPYNHTLPLPRLEILAGVSILPQGSVEIRWSVGACVLGSRVSDRKRPCSDGSLIETRLRSQRPVRLLYASTNHPERNPRGRRFTITNIQPPPDTCINAVRLKSSPWQCWILAYPCSWSPLTFSLPSDPDECG